MKKRNCMKNGGTVGSRTIAEQLTAIRGQVRPGYAVGGVPQLGTDDPPQDGGMAGQVGTFLGGVRSFGAGVGATSPASAAAQTGIQPVPTSGTTPGVASRTPSSPLAAIDQQIAMGKAMGGLSMVEQQALTNPGNQPYRADGSPVRGGGTMVNPGSAAAASMNDARLSALSSLRDKLAAQQPAASYADGGMVDLAEEALRRSQQKYGSQPTVSTSPAPQPTATPSPVQPTPAPASTGLADTLRKRQEELNRITRYADGGLVRFAGKGGPREDRIPVKVAGQNINVSDGEEAVILPAKTASSPQALASIASIIQATNDGRAPKMGVQDGAGYKVGEIPGESETDKNKYPYTGQPAQDIYARAGEGLGGALKNVAFPNTYQAIKTYGDAAQQAADAGNVGGAIGQTVRGGMAGVAGLGNDVLRSAAYVLDPAANALKTIVTGDSTPARVAPAGLASSATQSDVLKIDNAMPANAPVPVSAPANPNVGNVGDAVFNPTTGRLSFTQPGFDPTKQRVSDGTGMISRANGQTQVLTDLSPNQYVAADGTPNARWEQTQAYADAQQRAQADRDALVRLRAENAMANVNSPNEGLRAQGARQLQSLAAMQGIDAQSLAQAGQRQAVAANSPASAQQLAQQQIGTGQIALQNAKDLNALYAAHAAATTQEEKDAIAENIRARTGKDRAEEYVVHDGPSSVDPATGLVVKGAPVAISKRTGLPPPQQAALRPGSPRNFEEWAQAVRNLPANKGMKVEDAQLRKDYEAKYGAVR